MMRAKSQDSTPANQRDHPIAIDAERSAGTILSTCAESSPIEGMDDAKADAQRRPRHESADFGQARVESQQPHRVILVPPRLTDSQLKALLHAWCSHDAASGYMIVLSTALPGVRTNHREHSFA